ncbi:MAG: hypothetical protein EOO42_17160, partial [Flavobacteriales bacterium]
MKVFPLYLVFSMVYLRTHSKVTLAIAVLELGCIVESIAKYSSILLLSPAGSFLRSSVGVLLMLPRFGEGPVELAGVVLGDVPLFELLPPFEELPPFELVAASELDPPLEGFSSVEVFLFVGFVPPLEADVALGEVGLLDVVDELAIVAVASGYASK